jgi:hypothetical protein
MCIQHCIYIYVCIQHYMYIYIYVYNIMYIYICIHHYIYMYTTLHKYIFKYLMTNSIWFLGVWRGDQFPTYGNFHRDHDKLEDGMVIPVFSDKPMFMSHFGGRC